MTANELMKALLNYIHPLLFDMLTTFHLQLTADQFSSAGRKGRLCCNFYNHSIRQGFPVVREFPIVDVISHVCRCPA